MVFLSLLLISLISIYLRFINISPFKYYPDSYQNLIIAQNIKNFHSVLGTLGKDGLLYPPFFIWTRSIYPLLINFISIFTKNDIQSAYLVSFLLGVLSILLVYFLLSKIFSSKLVGIIGAAILGISFNHIVWGGFIFTETTGVFIILLTLFFLFLNIEKKSNLLNIKDLLTGILFSFCVFTRFEYIVLIFPITFYILQKSKNPKVKITNIFVSFLLTSSVILSQLYPLNDLIEIIFQQLNKFIKLGLSFTLIFITFFAINFFLPSLKKKLIQKLNYLLIFIIWIFFLLFLIPNLYLLTGIRNFFLNDFLIGITFLVGITYLLLKKKFSEHIYFSLISLFLLGLVYVSLNPLMQRYWTHNLPFLLIPSSYGLFLVLQFFLKRLRINKMLGMFIGVIILLTLMRQIYFSFLGIRNWHDGSWFRESYEEKAAKIVNSKIDKNNSFLIVSFPEPYYIFTTQTTHSISDQKPFIYIDESLNNLNAYIILDMGMLDIFPNFSEFVIKNLNDYKIDEFFIGETYHYKTYLIKESQPMKLYKLPLSTLKEIIAKN